MKAPCQGSKHFGGVGITWSCPGGEEGCKVEVSWQEEVILISTVDAYRPRLSFEIGLTDPPGEAVRGELVYQPEPGRLVLEDLSYPGGSVASVQLCPVLR